MGIPNINEILARPENKGYSERGADMGRRSQTNGEPEKLHLQRLQMVDGDYDTGGAYWGGPDADGCMWCAFSDASTINDPPIRVFVRAEDRREAAERAVLEELSDDGWSFHPAPEDSIDSCDEFTRGYVAAALWSSCDVNDEPFDKNYTPDDLAPAELLHIKADCQKFQQEQKELLAEAYALIGRPKLEMYTARQAGVDFWMTRARLGTGFLDSTLGDALMSKLTEAANKFHELRLYIGYDGKIWCERA